MEKKYFGTDGIRGTVGEGVINPEFMLKLGWAVGRVLAKSGSGKVLIGKDTRISGYMFESALEAGLSAAGIDSYLLGPMPTPAVAYLTRTYRANAGIVISASHNPYQDNGIKFFSSEGLKLPDEMELEIESWLDKDLQVVAPNLLGKAKRIDDAIGRYVECCKATIPSSMDLNNLKIVLDCAHGATYHIAPREFEELGAEVISIGVEPDGLNINENCGSTKPEALQASVVELSADVGIALDGDGDRLIMVDADGEIIDGDELLYIIARARIHAGDVIKGVVGTLMSNMGLEDAMQRLGGKLVRTQVGDGYGVETVRAKGYNFGCEQSGHLIFLGHNTTGDGILAGLQLLSIMIKKKKPLSKLADIMTSYPQVLENVRMSSKIAPEDIQGFPEALREAESQLGKRGRILVRPSGTEPVIRVMVEGEDEKEISTIALGLCDIIRRADRI